MQERGCPVVLPPESWDRQPPEAAAAAALRPRAPALPGRQWQSKCWGLRTPPPTRPQPSPAPRNTGTPGSRAWVDEAQQGVQRGCRLWGTKCLGSTTHLDGTRVPPAMHMPRAPHRKQRGAFSQPTCAACCARRCASATNIGVASPTRANLQKRLAAAAAPPPALPAVVLGPAAAAGEPGASLPSSCGMMESLGRRSSWKVAGWPTAGASTWCTCTRRSSRAAICSGMRQTGRQGDRRQQ